MNGQHFKFYPLLKIKAINNQEKKNKMITSHYKEPIDNELN